MEKAKEPMMLGTDTVGGNILVAVGDPYVHKALLAGLAREVFGYTQAGDTVTDPELAYIVIGA